KILVIVGQIGAKEKLIGYKAYLCNNNCSILPDWRSEQKRVTGWKQFERSLQQLFADPRIKEDFGNLEIHFVVDSPLFDRPFHLIPGVPGGRPIGQDVIVVVRDRQRLFSTDYRLKQAWRDRAEMLRRERPSTIKWVRLAARGELPSEKGLFYAAFALPDPGDG